jgi:hypothetical protein
MKATNFHWFSRAMDISTMSNTAQVTVFIHPINIEFNITEELAALMPMKWTITGKDLYEVKVMQSLNIPVQKLAGLVMDRVPSMREEQQCLCLSPI